MCCRHADLFESLRSHSVSLPVGARRFRSACSSPELAQQQRPPSHRSKMWQPRTAQNSPLRGSDASREGAMTLQLSQLGRGSLPAAGRSASGPSAVLRRSGRPGSLVDAALAAVRQLGPPGKGGKSNPASADQPVENDAAHVQQLLSADNTMQAEAAAQQEGRGGSLDLQAAPGSCQPTGCATLPKQDVEQLGLHEPDSAEDMSAPAAWTQPRDWQDILGK